MADIKHDQHKKKKKTRKVFGIILIEMLILALLFGGYRFYIYMQDRFEEMADEKNEAIANGDDAESLKNLTPEQKKAKEEQERLKKEEDDRRKLIEQADQVAVGYDYEGAVELLKSYQGTEGGYELYTSLTNAITRLEEEEKSLSLYGGIYHSVFEINHLYFNALIADTARAFDGDSNSSSYNRYNITVSEFKKILQSLYDQGYVLINVSDIATLVTQEDGTSKYVPNKFYLKEGKKPIIISEDDVNYYNYMLDDGFASKLVLDENGRITNEMILSDNMVSTGPFDIVPIVDAFVKEHPDFSYKGHKGLLTVTGYEGVLGYRTNDTTSATYGDDFEEAKKVAEALKVEGWEFGCHSWGHKDMHAGSLELLKRDTKRWQDEVGVIVGPTQIYAFPFGNDIEAGSGIYSSEKYKFLKESGFNYFLGVYKEPWLHIKNNYVRMTRRPVDGQAFIDFPDRLADLFKVEEIVYPSRPDKDW